MARFRTIVVFEGVETGDKRKIGTGALTTRALPLTLMAMDHNPEGGWGHDGAEVAGRIDTLTREDASSWVDEATGQTWGEVAGGQVFAWVGEGEFDDGEYGQKIEGFVADRTLRGVSVDLAATESEVEILEEDADGWPTDWLETVTAGEIAAATVCNIPAFRGCSIELIDDTTPEDPAAADSAQQEASTADQVALAASGEPWLPAFLYVSDRACEPCTTGRPAAVTAAGAPLHPPAAWFTDPGLDAATALTVTDDGRVFGHLATWGTCHVGYSGQCVTPPHSATSYALFHVGAVRTAEGDDVPVGHITLGTGHADTRLAAGAAAAHYDNTGTVVADVAAGEDEHGIWVAGALRPSVTDEQVRTLRAAALSGDWRAQGRGLELVAALAVNVPGFPVPRARAIAASGIPTALVAAGALAQPSLRPGRDVDEDTATTAVAQAQSSRAEQIRTAMRIGQARARAMRSRRALTWRH